MTVSCFFIFGNCHFPPVAGVIVFWVLAIVVPVAALAAYEAGLYSSTLIPDFLVRHSSIFCCMARSRLSTIGMAIFCRPKRSISSRRSLSFSQSFSSTFGEAGALWNILNMYLSLILLSAFCLGLAVVRTICGVLFGAYFAFVSSS